MRVSDPYLIALGEKRLLNTITWLGIHMNKLPNDAFIMQEIIYEVNPDYIIETGTGFGGSSLFFASILKLMNNNGSVITIDVKEYKEKFESTNIIYMHGSSVSLEIMNKLDLLIKGKNKKVLVLLDSEHKKNHVLQELNFYSRLVSVGSYLIVEDTVNNGNPIIWKRGEGPLEAVEEFLKTNDNFIPDISRERLIMTCNPKGWLKKIK